MSLLQTDHCRSGVEEEVESWPESYLDFLLISSEYQQTGSCALVTGILKKPCLPSWTLHQLRQLHQKTLKTFLDFVKLAEIIRAHKGFHLTVKSAAREEEETKANLADLASYQLSGFYDSQVFSHVKSYCLRSEVHGVDAAGCPYLLETGGSKLENFIATALNAQVRGVPCGYVYNVNTRTRSRVVPNPELLATALAMKFSDPTNQKLSDDQFQLLCSTPYAS